MRLHTLLLFGFACLLALPSPSSAARKCSPAHYCYDGSWGCLPCKYTKAHTAILSALKSTDQDIKKLGAALAAKRKQQAALRKKRSVLRQQAMKAKKAMAGKRKQALRLHKTLKRHASSLKNLVRKIKATNKQIGTLQKKQKQKSKLAAAKKKNKRLGQVFKKVFAAILKTVGQLKKTGALKKSFRVDEAVGRVIIDEQGQVQFKGDPTWVTDLVTSIFGTPLELDQVHR